MARVADDDRRAGRDSAMTSGSTAAAMRQIGTLFGSGTVAGMTDGQLLERFLARRDEGAEVAFAALVARHGPMVLGVCRRALADPGDAEDAFQATFLILVRRAHSVRVDDSLGRWLYGVSRKVAARARTFAARRPRHESTAFDAIEARSPDPDRFDVRSTIDEELARLPESYRSAVVLCDLGGLTLEEAARELGRPVGTIKSRLSRGRARLRSSLGRRGLAPSMKMAAPMVPARLAEAVVRTSMISAIGGASAAGTVPASAVALAEGMLKTMTGIKLKLAAAALLSIGIAATGAGVMARQEKGDARSTVPGKTVGPVAPDEPPSSKVQDSPAEIDHEKLARLLDERQRLLKRSEAARRISRDPKDPAIAQTDAQIRDAEVEIMRLVERDPNIKGQAPSLANRSRAIEAKLNQLVTLNITKQPLATVVIPHLQELTGVNFILDPKAMAENGLTQETPVTLKVEQVRLALALRTLLEPIALTYRVEDDILLITSRPPIDREARARLQAEFLDELRRARRSLARAEEQVQDPRDAALVRARKRAAELEHAVEEFQRLLSAFDGDDAALAGLPGRNRKPWPEGGPGNRPPGEFSKVSMPDYVVEPPDILRVQVP
jgi:RNA polymerase sigma factor (sigma-70 family)